MSRSVNKAVLIGHVGAEPEVRTAVGGRRVASFSLATSWRFRERTGTEQEKTEWHRVIAWDGLAERVGREVHRGGRVYVEGRLEYRSWEDAGGRKRYATEIVAEELIELSGPGGWREAGEPLPSVPDEDATPGGPTPSPRGATRGDAPGGPSRRKAGAARWEEEDLLF
jgi:single-strand DNA-binding protein